jgi:phosphatidylserine/phosphatidylglycerophosphate/cardiolipin synthase-like enzyme
LPTVTFSFGIDVVPSITEEICRATRYIRIAIFQIHSNKVFDMLSEKLKAGVKVEILTLPFDSINPDVRAEVEGRLRALEVNGARLYFDKWNVGDPSRTTTAVGRWYSFHGKFIVTDKCAIALSANLTDAGEMDASIIFRENLEIITMFNCQFDRLLRMFVTPHGVYDGSIRGQIVAIDPDHQKIFELPKNIGIEHKDHWIRHYPVQLCPETVPIEEKLYLTPFDCRGRNFFSSIIEDAEQYAYISTESFTDESFSAFLVSVAVNKKIEIKILSGVESMDFSDRIDNMFRDLLAQDIGVRTTTAELHAKLLITDKVLVVGSVNLNKINLGFHATLSYWRENTESLFVSKDPALIRAARKKYLEIYDSSQSVSNKLADKLDSLVMELFKGCFELSPNPEVRRLFSRFILKKQIEAKRIIIKIGKITKKLMQDSGRTRVVKEDFITALTLYHLSERKQDYDQLKAKMDEIGNFNVRAILNRLTMAGTIEKENDFYRINVEALF